MRPHRTGRLLGVAALALVLAGTTSACRPDSPDPPASDPEHSAPAEGDSTAEDAPDADAGAGDAPAPPANADRDATEPPVERAENVIIIVGDGMGIAHRELIRLATVGHDGQLVMNQLRFQGWTQTEPADPDRAVTDSAAAATALATGVRTETGVVSIAPDGTILTTLLERAAQADKATGVVTTAEVTDATPAAFAAHVPDRDQHEEIGRQYLEETGLHVILGGGADWWHAQDGAGPTLAERADQLGYHHVSDGDGLAAAGEELIAADGGRLLGLFAPGPMFTNLDHMEPRYDPPVPLPVMARSALDVLSRDPDGFFLLIEEEGIDSMAHRGNAEETLRAGQALDETVAVVREFAREDGETLVIVAGDHETGGLAVESLATDEAEQADEGVNGPFTVAGTDLIFDVEWTTGGHTAAATPASAEGPGAQQMVDVRHHTDLHDLVLHAMALDDE